MSNITFVPTVMGNLFGRRFALTVVKQCKGMPGFAPEFYEKECGQLVVNYKDLEPFWQFFDEPPNLELNEVLEIYEKLKRGFVEDDFKHLMK